MEGARRVFLSHTSELRQYAKARSFVEAAEAAISRSGDAVTDMAYFTAQDDKSADYCERRVRDSDIYVGLVGLRYGSIVRDRPDLSYTELEFEAATNAGLPRLVFLLDEDAALPIPARVLYDSDPDFQVRQRAFRDRLIGAGITMVQVATPDELEVALLQALVECHAGRDPGRGGPAVHGGPAALPRPEDVTAPSGTHNLPRRPARVFVGRDDELARLAIALTGGASAVVTQAVYGLGGVGKSELALHYAHARRAGYSLIWWITAEDQTEIQAGLAALTTRLCRDVATARTTAEAAWATAWLQCHDRWLLILDNVNDPGDVAPLLGQLTTGHIVITTRRDAGWDQIADPIRLDVLDPAPAADLLTARTSQRDPAGQAAATAIAAELGFLPLALDQAAAYITQTKLTLARYLGRLRQRPAAMHAAGAGPAQRTIARVWDITIEAIQAHDPDAVRLLRILACYAPDAIPRVVLGSPGDQATDAAIDEALGALASYSMITLTPDSVSMHRLVQAVIRARLAPPPGQDGAFGADDPLGTALDWLYDVIPDSPDTNMVGWPLLRALLPHAESLADLYLAASETPGVLGHVQNELAEFLTSQGQHAQAHQLLESALAITEAALGPDHPETAIRLHNLATTYRDLGQPVDALPLAQRALAITEATHGPDHPDPDTAIRLGNLALTYRDLGRPADALPLAQRAVTIAEATLGPGHPETAFRLHNLALTYRDLGRPAVALPLAQRALAITEATLGPGHPRTATRLSNLAATHNDLRQPADALPLAQRALAIAEATLGPDHPETAFRLHTLATTYHDLKQPADALPLAQRALAITETTLGPDHPHTARALTLLAVAHHDLGRPADALPLAQRALAITESALGSDHPSTAIRLNNLAAIHRALGRPDEPLPLEQRAQSIRQRNERPDRPSA